MTWPETHRRLRIIRQVEAAAAVDMTGTLPWREQWAPYFGDRDGLLIALRARWMRMCEAQLDAQAGEDQLHDTHLRLRRTNAGILRILRRYDVAPVPHPAAPEPASAPAPAAAPATT